MSRTGRRRPPVASYRLQLTPEFGFERVSEQLDYLARLGVSHLYLSPITEAVPGSTHGYDVTDHNQVRQEFGGREAFERLREAAVARGLQLIVDFVPNHAGVGSDNEAWQDVLAYGPYSPHAATFDIDWNPPEPNLRGKLLLPFLGRPYGEALDEGELVLGFERGNFHAAYFDNRFRISPATVSEVLAAALPFLERQEGYFDLHELQRSFADLAPDERDRAEALRERLIELLEDVDLEPVLGEFRGERLHGLLERQFWRLAYWKTAGDEINYRRFFDVNGLAGLRMDRPEVFWANHRLLAELVREEGVVGVRIDHVDGLLDPHAYLRSLRELGPEEVWVEKILAPGEILPEGWPVSGTTGYEFMNDVVRILIDPDGVPELLRTYRRHVDPGSEFHDVALRSKRLIMETSLAGDLNRLAGMLNALSEADYRTRDFTQPALRDALAAVVASFERYRTYLPHQREEGLEVLRRAVSEARRRAVNVETSVFEFIYRLLEGPMPEALEPLRQEFMGRVQQYTAPVAAKGVEDTAFYRFVPLAALNEVGGEPDVFTVEPQAFHSRARFRQHRYPLNLLATATHDHKRGEDTRMRLAALSELAPQWSELATFLHERAQHYWLEAGPLGTRRVSDRDAYLFHQHLLALWPDSERGELTERLTEYLVKAVREAKSESSWINPDETYEQALADYVASTIADAAVSGRIGDLAEEVADLGFRNSIAQLVLKLTTPGLPDIYQGSELLDLSLVDPDNRRPVDYELRARLLDELDEQPPDADQLRDWLEKRDPRLKLHVLRTLLRYRGENAGLFDAPYRSCGDDAEAAGLAFLRERDDACLLVVVPRFTRRRERGDFTRLRLPAGEWRELLSNTTLKLDEGADEGTLPFLPAVLTKISRGSEGDS